MPLIGRAGERSLLRTELRTAAAGRTRVALVAGEPGIGKSSLLAAIAGDAAAGGTVVLRGGVSEAEGMPPYLPSVITPIPSWRATRRSR